MIARIPLSLLLTAWLSPGMSHGQFHMGPELRGTYVKDYRTVLPGMAVTASGKLGKRTYWRAEASWHLPKAGQRSRMSGPRQLAAGGDTHLREVNARYRDGLMGVAVGAMGTFGKNRQRNVRGMFWETMLAFDDRTHWGKGTSRYVHTGEVREWRYTSHQFILSLRVGGGYRLPLGSGQLRFAFMGTPFALEFQEYGGNDLEIFPMAGIGVTYQWSLGA